MPVWWTKRSLPDSSGVMKPKPLSSLNHLTVPVAISRSLLGVLGAAIAEGAQRQRLGTLARLSPGCSRQWTARRIASGPALWEAGPSRATAGADRRLRPLPAAG